MAKLLVIEDNELIAVALIRMLEMVGYEVLAADSLQAARQVITTHADVIDVIVSDINLGDGSSRHLHAAVRSLLTAHGINWISMTASVGPSRARAYFKDHGIPVVDKEDIEELLEAIKEAFAPCCS